MRKRYFDIFRIFLIDNYNKGHHLYISNAKEYNYEKRKNHQLLSLI